MESTTDFEKLLFLWGSRTVPLISERQKKHPFNIRLNSDDPCHPWMMIEENISSLGDPNKGLWFDSTRKNKINLKCN